MKNLLIILLLISPPLHSQMKFEKSIKKLGLDSADVIYTNEAVLLYPRGLIYNLSQTDSIGYFGCISTDQRHFVEFFEDYSQATKLLINAQINRVAGEFADTIKFEPLEIKAQKFSYSDPSKQFIINDSIHYVVLFYWNSQVIDRNIIKNFLFFKKYIRNHPELSIELIPLCTDKIIGK